MVFETCDWDFALRDIRRALRAAGINRKAIRKGAKERSRKSRIHTRMKTLLQECPSTIISRNVLSKEEVEFLGGQYREALEGKLDFWPISKLITNKIRNYIHFHKHRGKSLLDVVCKNGCLSQEELVRYLNIQNNLSSMDTMLYWNAFDEIPLDSVSNSGITTTTRSTRRSRR